ncbi:MAG: endonuclease YncB(thermonuclease family), partial [Myxococcota bacterium]
ATSERVTVECVYDGDTFYVGGCSDSEADDTIRLLGIQAPELRGGDNGEEPECYGTEAADFLAELLEGQTVVLEYDVECTGVFGRTLAWVWLEGTDPAVISMLQELDGLGMIDDTSYEVLVNELMLRAGYAELYENDVANNIRYDEYLDEAVEDAEEEAAGLWGECSL